ncbi:MAG: Zn finger-containing GTPase- Activating Protein for ARF [Alectoria fallacina]|uniref:Zn finger-containing GTPase- Activating Protein for ARF n=1 Tax=Alectoria fallacina TaxID=1903189 RepID=A0A8H3PDG7_9LECA|nr:MAG: Zn finger-containing GTPase- Activating Protein for ARF [Alectoria fallacina]
MWEVDPETKTKLATLQKRPGNTTCIDCSAPSPQWASPKFGTFICLTCAGLHRGLGVHISFVRSIQMDSFKPAEISRMELGGNNTWKEFWESKSGQRWGKPGQGGDGEAMRLVGDRYGGDEGEEYKERLGCKVEGREFSGMPVRERKKMESRGMESSTARTSSPLAGAGPRSQKAQNEGFFARKGNENASRPDGLAPSQGGKYGGFGSEPAMPTAREGSGGALPGVDDFQKDPVAALSKGFGWFTSTVGKGAKTVNDGWIQPTAQKIAEADLATTARLTAAQAAKTIQTGTKGAADRFNSFVEDTGTGGSGGAARSRGAVEPERRDFWDSFGDAGAEKKSGAIGTAAMRKGGGGGNEGKEEGWGDW